MSLTKRLGVIEKLKVEQQELKGMIDEALDRHDDYAAAKAHQTAARRDLNIVRDQVLNEPANRSAADKLKEVRSELAEERALLAQELAVYFSKEGKSEITLPDGTVLRFRLSATLTGRPE